MDEWISVKEASEELKVSPRTVTNWIHQRKLKAKRGDDGREWFVHRELSPPPEDWRQDISQKVSESSENDLEDAKNAPSHGAAYLEKELEMQKKEVLLLERTNGLLQQQLETRDEQINQLHQLLAIAQTNLQHEQLALVDLRQQTRPWWRRLFSRSDKLSYQETTPP